MPLCTFNVGCLACRTSFLQVGTGILGLPYTLAQGGWLAILLIIGIGVMTNYTGKLVVASLYRSSTGPRGSRLAGYPAIGTAAYGRAGLAVVHVFHKATLFGVASLFLILAAEFLLEGIGGGPDGGFAPHLAQHHTVRCRSTQTTTFPQSNHIFFLPILADTQHYRVGAVLRTFNFVLTLAVMLMTSSLYIFYCRLTNGNGSGQSCPLAWWCCRW